MQSRVSNNLNNSDFLSMGRRPVLTLTIEKGPDKGEQARFDQARIILGSDEHCDLQIKGHGVKPRHCAFFRTDNGFLFQDIGSGEGSRLALADRSAVVYRAEDEPLPIEDSAMLHLGDVLVRIGIDRVSLADHEAGAFRLKLSGEEAAVMASHKADTSDLPELRSGERRLDTLLELGIKLNRLNQLSDILDLIAFSAFDCLPHGNLLSISMLGNDEIKPLLVRTRDLGELAHPEVILSKSVLRRVMETEEAVLFVRGDEQATPSHSLALANISSCMCAPLVGQRGLHGVIQLDTRGSGHRFSRNDLNQFCLLASHTAFALERAGMAEKMTRMFEGFVAASVHAIEDRDPTTAGHSERVAKYSLALAERVNTLEVGNLAPLNFSRDELTELRYAALLHDFGKVGVRECVLMKDARLDVRGMEVIKARFELMTSHYRHALFRAYLQKTRLRSQNRN